jgi:hypothetical protein
MRGLLIGILHSRRNFFSTSISEKELQLSIYRAQEIDGMKHMKLKKSSKNNRHLSAHSLPHIIVITFLTGCGGVPEGYTGEPTGNEPPQAFHILNQQNVNGTTGQQALSEKAATSSGSLASSFTLNPTENFKGFNPEIWNDQKSWYECNCGYSRSEMPKRTPWNTTG